MKYPRKAFLLAAGLGTRMRPLTDAMPKPALPLWGKPLITHILDMMADWGVRDVLINLHHQPSELLALLRDYANASRRMRICLSFEPDVLGTGGAIRRAAWFLDDKPFWLINTDIAADVRPEPFIRAWNRSEPIAALWLTQEAGPRTVEMTGGAIRTFRSTSPGSAYTYTFCGLHLVHPGILQHIPDEPVASIIGAYDHAMQDGHRVTGVTVAKSFWRDLGTPAHYLETHGAVQAAHQAGRPGANLYAAGVCRPRQELSKAKVIISGFAAAAHDATVLPRASLEDTVVMDRAIVGRVRLSNAIVAPDSLVSTDLTGVVMPASSVQSVPGVADVARRLYGSVNDVLYCALPARGSDRSFARLVAPPHRDLDKTNAAKSAILIHYGHERPENASYATLARFLRHKGIPVPRVLVDLPNRRILAMEDAGPDSLEARFPEMPTADGKQLYRRVIHHVLRLHQIPPSEFARNGIALQPRFDATLYHWEHQLLLEKFLQGRLGMKASHVKDVANELEQVSSRLLKAPLVPLHRDLQSSNIHLKPGAPDICFIDFQGMRLGPAVYDLASLLCDPYVMLPLDLQEELLEAYAAQSERPAMIRRLFWPGAIQRLAQALGAYGRLAAAHGTARFARYIPPAIEMMNRAIDHSGMGLPALRRVLAQIQAHRPEIGSNVGSV
jgi:NDP-sugar pyrophosphorylase family protein/aminoglycoside/choline kinase family phosphotransferase